MERRQSVTLDRQPMKPATDPRGAYPGLDHSRKLAAITLLAGLFLLGVGGTCGGIRQASTASNRQRVLSTILTEQLDAEIAHNAATSDVWEAIAVLHVNDVAAAATRYQTAAQQWHTSLAAVASSDLPPTLRAPAHNILDGTTKVIAVGRAAVSSAVPAATSHNGVTTISHAVQGNGVNQFEYMGDWSHSTANELSGERDSYCSMPGDTATLRFNGTQTALPWSHRRPPWHGHPVH
jgi:hypothetical protein